MHSLLASSTPRCAQAARLAPPCRTPLQPLSRPLRLPVARLGAERVRPRLRPCRAPSAQHRAAQRPPARPAPRAPARPAWPCRGHNDYIAIQPMPCLAPMSQYNLYCNTNFPSASLSQSQYTRCIAIQSQPASCPFQPAIQ